MKFTAFISLLQIVNGANILVISSVASPSHDMWNNALTTSLVQRGHNITVLGLVAKKNSDNFTTIVMEGISEKLSASFDPNGVVHTGGITFIKLLWEWASTTCHYALNTEGLKVLLNYPPNFNFDLIMWDLHAGECLYPLIRIFGNPPVLGISPAGYPTYFTAIFGISNPSFVPFYGMENIKPMSFIERLENTFYTFLLNGWRKYIYLPGVYQRAVSKFGDNIEDFNDVERNISLLLSNSDTALNEVEALPPNVIPVGGLHIQKPKELPQELKMIFDQAKDGIIYFSMGTNVRSDKFSQEKIKAILQTFSKLPQTVLWKFESEIEDLPKNVIIKKWFPQNDILAMKNVKLFITHGGALSSFEAIHHGVPIIAIPFVYDQFYNARKLVSTRVGKRIYYGDITEDLLYDTITEVLKDPMFVFIIIYLGRTVPIACQLYVKNMKKLSARFHDQPLTPMERAIFWTEYLLRHKSAETLNVAVRDMNIHEIFLWDILLLLIVSFVLIFVLIFKIVNGFYNKFASINSIKKIKKN